LLSNNRKAINYKLVFIGLAIETLLAFLVLKIPISRHFFGWMVQIIGKIFYFSNLAADFVFGPLANSVLLDQAFGKGNGFIFFFKIIPNIIFISVLVSMAYHVGIIQKIVSLLAKVLHKLMDISGSEALSNIASAVVGQVEAQLIIKHYLKGMTMSELLSSMSGSMACIPVGGISILLLFGINAEYLLTAVVMSIPGSLVISKIVFPETQSSETKGKVELKIKRSSFNLIDSISNGAITGLKVSLNVIAMLIGFITLIALFDYSLGKVGSLFNHPEISMKYLSGWCFSGFAFLMGVPMQDIKQAGELMGTKLISNEMVAYINMAKIMGSLQPKTIMILTFALCGFANFSSIGIQVGGIGEMVPERRKDLATLGFKAMICGTLSSYLSACIAGML